MHVSMQSSNHLNIWPSNHQNVQSYKNDGSIHVSGHVIIKACRHCIRSSKHVNIKEYEHRSMWSLKHVNIQACDYESIHAYEHLSTQIHIPLISQPSQQSNTIVNTFKHKNVLLHDHFSLWTNRHFSFSKYVHMCMDIKHVNINACEHAIIEAFENSSR